jgi:hypothetical protein
MLTDMGRAEQVARAVVLKGAYAAHSRPIRLQATPAAGIAGGGVDQPACRPRGGASAISRMTCLIEVDKLRSGCTSVRL